MTETTAQRSVFVVTGESGVYSDHRAWMVISFMDEESATEFAKQATDHLKELAKDEFFIDRFEYWDQGGPTPDDLARITKYDSNLLDESGDNARLWHRDGRPATYGVIRVPIGESR